MNYGIDPDGPLPDDDDSNTIVVPPILGIDNEQYEDLALAIDPMGLSDDYGIDIYLQCLDFVQNS